MKTRLFHVLLVLLTALGCWAGRGQAAVGDDVAIVQHALALAQDDRMEAIQVLESYLETGSDPELLPTVRLYAGEQRRLSGDPVGAATHFRALVADAPDSPAAEAASLGVALLDSASPSGNTLATLGLVGTGVPDTMNADRYRVLALFEEDEDAARSFARKALVFSQSDAAVESRVRRDLADYLQDEPGDADTGAPIAGGADEIALERARRALAERRLVDAADQARGLLETFPDSDRAPSAEWILKRADAGDPYNATTVGVLLPLSGTWAPPGKLLKQSFELALEGTGVDLIYRDTEGDPEKALAAFEELVLQEGVAAVIGPLLKESAFPVAEAAHHAGVPLMALTQAPGVTDAGPEIFRGLMTVDQQIQGLLDEVMDEQGMTKFAVMAPNNAFGQNALDTFNRRVVERGGAVTVHAMYDPSETSFRGAAVELGRKDYEARKGELYRLRREAEEKGMDPSKVVLPPTMDFDAIFIPDSYQRVALVAASLAYEEFAIGEFSPRRHLEPVPLLGLNGWHNDDLVNRGGKYTQGCYFVDAWDPGSDAYGVRDFIAAYKASYSRTPGVLEAMGYDAARLLFTTARTRPASRSAFMSSLQGANIRDPVTGGTSFGETREIERELLVFTISANGGMHRADWTPPPPPPE